MFYFGNFVIFALLLCKQRHRLFPQAPTSHIGAFLFCLVDVCRVLDLSNPTRVKSRIEDALTTNEVIYDSLGRATMLSHEFKFANLGAFLKKRRCCNLSQHLQLPFNLHSRHKYTSLFVYIYTLNAKKTINNSYINFKVVFAGEISKSFFGIVFALQILKSFLPRNFRFVFTTQISKSFLLGKFRNRFSLPIFKIVFSAELRLTIRVLTLFVNRVTTCDTNSPMYWSFRTLCHAQFWTLQEQSPQVKHRKTPKLLVCSYTFGR